MNLHITNRVALVTGGSQGIGQAIAEQLAAEGARVVLTYHSEKERADAIASKIGGRAVRLSLDDPQSSIDAVKATIAAFGSIDILVNNAVMWGRPGVNVEDMPLDEWQRVFRGNLEGAYAAIQVALPPMRAQKWGRIVNVSSGVALDGVTGQGPYGAAKSALHGLTAIVSREAGADNVLANVVVPGITITERIAKHVTPELHAARAAGYPIKRLLAPDEVAPTVVFLCSGANTAVTGEIVRASGGRPYPY